MDQQKCGARSTDAQGSGCDYRKRNEPRSWRRVVIHAPYDSFVVSPLVSFVGRERHTEHAVSAHQLRIAGYWSNIFPNGREEAFRNWTQQMTDVQGNESGDL